MYVWLKFIYVSLPKRFAFNCTDILRSPYMKNRWSFCRWESELKHVSKFLQGCTHLDWEILLWCISVWIPTDLTDAEKNMCKLGEEKNNNSRIQKYAMINKRFSFYWTLMKQHNLCKKQGLKMFVLITNRTHTVWGQLEPGAKGPQGN